MLIALAAVWIIVLLVAAFAHRRRPAIHGEVLRGMGGEARALALKVPLALFAAGFAAQLMPQELIGGAIGESSGVTGIILASVVGAILPGGPMVTFPVVLVFFQSGAGLPQVVALLSAWALMGAHRVLAFELPMMGPRFVAIRLAATLPLPVLAGLLAGLLSRALAG